MNFKMFGNVTQSNLSENSCGFEGTVPKDLEVFKDHFPDFPVLPGVLSLEIMKLCLEQMTSQDQMTLSAIKRVKFSSYLKPGNSWKVEVLLKSKDDEQQHWKAKLYTNETLSSSADFNFSL